MAGIGFNFPWKSVSTLTDLGYESNSDWYLPSLVQLQRMYSVLHLYSLGNFANTGVPEDDYYWSSVEGDGGGAWVLWFGDGSSGNYLKTNYDHVRAMRDFTTVGDLYNLRDTGPSGGLIYYKQFLFGVTWVYEECLTYDQSTSATWAEAVSICNNFVN